jgi:hypothetical protein
VEKLHLSARRFKSRARFRLRCYILAGYEPLRQRHAGKLRERGKASISATRSYGNPTPSRRLRPRLIIHMTAKIAQLEYDIADNGLRRPRIGERYSKEHEEHCRRIGERLDRAHAILRALTESEDHK